MKKIKIEEKYFCIYLLLWITFFELCNTVVYVFVYSFKPFSTHVTLKFIFYVWNSLRFGSGSRPKPKPKPPKKQIPNPNPNPKTIKKQIPNPNLNPNPNPKTIKNQKCLFIPLTIFHTCYIKVYLLRLEFPSVWVWVWISTQTQTQKP